MNKLSGKIIAVNTSDQFSLVKLEVKEVVFLSIVIASPVISSNLKCGNFINLVFKETDVTLCTKIPDSISIINKIPAIITHKESGILLTRFELDFKGHLINAVVSTSFGEKMNRNDRVIMLIRSNEIMLME